MRLPSVIALLPPLLLLLAACGRIAEESSADAGVTTPPEAGTPRDASLAPEDAQPPEASAYDSGTLECLGAPPTAATRCAMPSDCTRVTQLCVCGPAPVYGVNTASFARVQACEEDRSMRCPIDCAGISGYVAQDGRVVSDAGAIEVECVGSPGTCLTRAP
jgi:hypothetical protein